MSKDFLHGPDCDSFKEYPLLQVWESRKRSVRFGERFKPGRFGLLPFVRPAHTFLHHRGTDVYGTTTRCRRDQTCQHCGRDGGTKPLEAFMFGAAYYHPVKRHQGSERPIIFYSIAALLPAQLEKIKRLTNGEIFAHDIFAERDDQDNAVFAVAGPYEWLNAADYLAREAVKWPFNKFPLAPNFEVESEDEPLDDIFDSLEVPVATESTPADQSNLKQFTENE
jgi:hypothetical protein